MRIVDVLLIRIWAKMSYILMSVIGTFAKFGCERKPDTEKVKFIPAFLSRSLILSDNIINRRFGAK